MKIFGEYTNWGFPQNSQRLHKGLQSMEREGVYSRETIKELMAAIHLENDARRQANDWCAWRDGV